MSNSQSASSKLHPFNNVKNQSNVIAAVHKKDNLYTASGKENVDINKKQTNIRNKKASHSETSETKSHNSSLLSKVKNLISLWESSKKEETEKHFTKHGEGSTRVQSTVEEKEFPKTEFKIYTGAKKKNKPTYGSKHCSEILKEEPKRIKRVETSRNVLIEKRIQLLKPRRLENQTVNDRVKNLRVEGRVNEDINETPVDVLPSLINRKKIKLQHKKSSYEEKYLQSQKNNLPAKLLYNVEYIGDFIELQLSLEQLHQLSSNFLRKGINRHQRKLVVSYLIKVTAYSKYPSFILYQAVKILDNMLDKKWIDVNELQIMGLTALWITLKRIHTTADIPSATDILYFCKGEYTPEDLFNCELNIMGTLKCELSFIDPFSILAYLFIHINNPFLEVKHTDQMYYCASYLIDVSLLSSTLCKGSTILLIMAAAELALFVILAKADELKNPNWNFWRHSLPNIYNDGRNLNEAEIEMTRKNLIKLALLSKNLSEDYFSVYEKYKRSRYGCISEIMIGRLLKVSQSSCKHSETAS